MVPFLTCFGAALVLVMCATERCSGSAVFDARGERSDSGATNSITILEALDSVTAGAIRTLLQQDADADHAAAQQPMWRCPSGGLITDQKKFQLEAAGDCKDAPESEGKLRCGSFLASPQLVADVFFKRCKRVEVQMPYLKQALTSLMCSTD